ncbi:HAD-IB family hydrolase [Salinibacter ruber]|uniref:HAD-IB family hydrolase n=1 Tax=Salinibacter ruber TaxID=146919 RepID=UPI00216976E5|nr:HAD superfamily hydrolase (TIGR01490 family) [Salinibacter ruber]
MSKPSDPPAEPVEEERPVVAVFDFDGTLTRRDSLVPFLWQVAGPWAFIRNATVLLPTLLRYAVGILENGPAKERVLGQFLAGKATGEIRAIAESFAAERVPWLLDPEAVRRLRWHQEQGHKVILVTASPELYARPWAEAEGFDEVIGTRLETKEGVFTGQFATPNCHGPEKTRRLEAEGPDLRGTTVYAYGNSRGDRELLAMADQEFYRSFGDSQGDPHETDPEESEERAGLPEGWQRGLLYSIVGGAGLYLGLTLWSGAEQIWQGLRAVSPLTLAGLLLLVLAGYLVRFGRWHWYLRYLGETVSWRDNLKAFLASFALTATPGKAGESVKAYFLKRSSNVDPSRSLAGLFAERFTDVFSVVLVICVGLFSLPQGRWIVLGIGGVQIAGIALLQRPRWARRAVLLPVAGWSTARRWVRPVDTMLSDTSALLRPRVLLGGILLGGLPWIGEGVAMYVLFDALGAEAIALHEAILIHAAATLFGAVTFLPGGLGGHEAASVSLSLLYGATQSQAVVATVLIRLLTLWFAVMVGIIISHTVVSDYKMVESPYH